MLRLGRRRAKALALIHDYFSWQVSRNALHNITQPLRVGRGPEIQNQVVIECRRGDQSTIDPRLFGVPTDTDFDISGLCLNEGFEVSDGNCALRQFAIQLVDKSSGYFGGAQR